MVFKIQSSFCQGFKIFLGATIQVEGKEMSIFHPDREKSLCGWHTVDTDLFIGKLHIFAQLQPESDYTTHASCWFVSTLVVVRSAFLPSICDLRVNSVRKVLPANEALSRPDLNGSPSVLQFSSFYVWPPMFISVP